MWKHVDERTGAAVRRQRRLVVSFHVTVANYEYLVYWRFYQDGNIECEVRATGIVVTSHVVDGEPLHGTVVDQGTYAPFHQHFIVARLDLDVDGPDNTVYAVSSEASSDDPYGLGLVVRERPLRTGVGGEAGLRLVGTAGLEGGQRGRAERAGLPGRIQARAVRGVPAAARPLLTGVLAGRGDRAHAMGHAVPSGRAVAVRRLPNLSLRDAGLPAWTAADRPIENTDVVLWYVFGIHHITRPEDWPVMPTDAVSFWLKPFGFSSRNPALDVPPSH